MFTLKLRVVAPPPPVLVLVFTSFLFVVVLGAPCIACASEPSPVIPGWFGKLAALPALVLLSP